MNYLEDIFFLICLINTFFSILLTFEFIYSIFLSSTLDMVTISLDKNRFYISIKFYHSLYEIEIFFGYIQSEIGDQFHESCM